MATYYRFKQQHDVRVSYGVIKAYEPGQVVFVPEAHAASADKAGAGERLAREQARSARGSSRGE